MNAIEIKHLTKTFKEFQINNVNLIVPSGSIVGLIGENGSGKSTIFKLILNIIQEESGSISILGRSNKENLQLIKEDIGVVLDELGIPGTLNTKEINNIMKHTYKNWDSGLFKGYLEKLKIPQNKQFKHFSRGMKMKLSIAIALSHHAKLLLLDEPTSGLDPVIRDEIVDIFSEFTREENHSILITSHIVSDLEKLCDYIAFLKHGNIILFDEKDRITEEYGIIHGNVDDFTHLDHSAIISRKELKYGVELLVKRNKIPSEFSIMPIDIERLFVFMVKGE